MQVYFWIKGVFDCCPTFAVPCKQEFDRKQWSGTNTSQASSIKVKYLLEYDM